MFEKFSVFVFATLHTGTNNSSFNSRKVITFSNSNKPRSFLVLVTMCQCHTDLDCLPTNPLWLLGKNLHSATTTNNNSKHIVMGVQQPSTE